MSIWISKDCSLSIFNIHVQKIKLISGIVVQLTVEYLLFFSNVWSMHFIYYINRLIVTKVDPTNCAIDRRQTAYVTCSERWAQTSDV